MSPVFRKIKKNRNRVVLSDILPFETPLIFSNRHFYSFLNHYNIKLENKNLSWRANIDGLDELIRIIFSIPEQCIIDPSNQPVLFYGKDNVYMQSLPYQSKELSYPLPYTFKISHVNGDHRALTIFHPYSQLKIIDFYSKYKSLILYYCKISSFSIRFPFRISSLQHITKHNRKSIHHNISDGIETSRTENESLRSFFFYKKYNNIHKFYESYEYHRAEKKFDNLLKVDISKCFDSIYTHSISWAVIGESVTKNNLVNKGLVDTFADDFDKLMQGSNQQHTNGIVIGPEISRIFAEIILQAIDRQVEKNLKEKFELQHGREYQIFRYVDDYFIFHNSNIDRENIQFELQSELKKYNLFLNHGKSALFEKPIITDISMAKQEIVNLLDELVALKPLMDDDLIISQVSVKSNKLITNFKTILKSHGLEYREIMAFSLSILNSKLEGSIPFVQGKLDVEFEERGYIKALNSLLEFTFFIYSVDPKVASTIRLCRIVGNVLNLFRIRAFGSSAKEAIKKIIFDNIRFLLKKNKITPHSQIETIYLLICLAELGKDYTLTQEELAAYLGIQMNGETFSFRDKSTIQYFTYVVILYYIKNQKKYEDLKQFVENEILSEIHKHPLYPKKSTEIVMLFLDTVSCPYVSDRLKTKLIKAFCTSHKTERKKLKSLIESRSWFIKWSNFNFNKELDLKKSQEVY